jgi:hypothetical protein
MGRPYSLPGPCKLNEAMSMLHAWQLLALFFKLSFGPSSSPASGFWGTIGSRIRKFALRLYFGRWPFSGNSLHDSLGQTNCDIHPIVLMAPSLIFASFLISFMSEEDTPHHCRE